MVDAESKGPLSGLRVLDLTTIVMGPLCTRHLSDLGASVLKVEEPSGGDLLRATGPNGQKGMGPLFLDVNRGKKSIAIDLKKDEGREIFYRLVTDYDIVVTNLRPKAIKDLSINYENLKKINSNVIFCQLVGFGQGGPYAPLAAYDDIIQAASGIPMMLANNTGGDPVYVPDTIVDRIVGTYAFGVVLAAVYERFKSGIGRYVEVSMYEMMASFVLGDHLYGHKYIPNRGPLGYPRMFDANRKPFRTRDGFLCCIIYTDKHWKAFLKITGESEKFIFDPRFNSSRNRIENIKEFTEFVADRLSKRDTSEWLRLMRESDIPVFPLLSLEDLVSDKHLIESGFISNRFDEEIGQYKELGLGSFWGQQVAGNNSRRAPFLGENTNEVLHEMGFEESLITSLSDKGVVAGR